MFGLNPFSETYENLERLAKEYRQWHGNVAKKWSAVPERYSLVYQIHHNLSNETMSRAELLSELTGRRLDDTLIEVLKARSMPIPIDAVNGAMVYASTIYRGKTQVNTGTWFEQKVTGFVNDISDMIRMVPGRSHQGSKFDKDILIRGERRLSAEISFQVTTNSVMERKSHLRIPGGYKVIMVFGGLGWIERINALERIASSESGYSECFGPSEKEFDRLKAYLLSHT